jgi:hypothetical protein
MTRIRLHACAAAALWLVASHTASAGVFGSLSNFDVVNDTGQTAHGFEIDLEGLHSSDITDTFGGLGRGFPSTVERYGAPTVSEYNAGGVFGVKVSYLASFAGGVWSTGTPSGVYSTPGESCWTGGGIGYGPSTPCDHFGVGTLGNPIKTSYNWLIETATPGVLSNGAVNIPAPLWTVTPPADPAAGVAPVVAAQIKAPKGENEARFGTPIWVKVFTTELEGPVGLEELVGGNPKVAEAESHTEVEWQLLQTDPGNPLAGVLENDGNGAIGAGAKSVLRRYEFFNYAGAFDPETHEALVQNDSQPAAGELGSFIGAQNAAINLDGAPRAPVPEPRSAVLLMAGLAVWFARQAGRRGAGD